MRIGILALAATIAGTGIGMGVPNAGAAPAAAPGVTAPGLRALPVQQDIGPTGPRQTALPLPRYASLRASEVNMRSGPGVRYPVDWIYKRRDLPVQIIAEFDHWRKIRDPSGTVGWIHRSMLTGKRTAVILVPLAVLRRTARADAPALARLEAGVITGLDACNKDWCRIEVSGLTGWIERAAIWGATKDEKFD